MKFILLIFLVGFSSLSYGKNIDYKIDGKSYEGFLLLKSKKAPTVFIVHDWDGIDDYEVKRAQMIYKLGYSVFLIDMFGKGIRPSEIEERKKLTGELYKDRSLMRKLLNEGLQAAKSAGLNTDKSIVVGYCFGGTSALEWAKSGVALKGFAIFHGGLKVEDNDSYKESKGKIIVFHGSADESVSLKDFSDLATLFEKEKIQHEMITYSGAPHAFTKFDSDRYRKEADEKSWRRFKEFLKETL